MTIGAIVLDVIIIISVLLSAIYIGIECESLSTGVITFLIGFIIVIGIGVGQFWYYNNSESGKRAIKTQNSNYSGGIKRQVKIYDINGKLIQEYKGKFDVDSNEERIIFDDEKGKRHTIYYSTATVIIDELKDDDKQ